MMLRLATLIALFGLMSTLAAQDVVKPTSKVEQSLYPTSIGTKWTYTIVGQNKQMDVTVARTEKVGTTDCVVLEASVEVESVRQVVATEHMALEKGIYQRLKLGNGEVNPPLIFLKNDAKKEDTWKAEFEVKMVMDGKPVTAKAKTQFTVSEEKVKVPAGEYDTTVIRGKTEEDGKVTDSAVWYAKGVGPVKQEFDFGGGNKFTLELKAVSVKK